MIAEACLADPRTAKSAQQQRASLARRVQAPCDDSGLGGDSGQCFPNGRHHIGDHARHFTHDLGKGGAVSAIPRVFGIGPQLAALEKMAYPTAGLFSGLIGAAIDAVGDALGLGGADDGPTRAVPRQPAPRILFIWGPSRLVPVQIRSMVITEQKYDPLLNPVQAEVRIGLAIPNAVPGSDKIGQGAMAYTSAVKDAQAILNLAKAVELAIDVIPF